MGVAISEEHLERLAEMYGGGLPDYLSVKRANMITMRAAQYEGAPVQMVSITPADVVQYFRQDNPLGCAGMSGCRQLADFATDWRTVDAMAQEALRIYRILNRPALDKEAAKHGMRLREAR